MTDILSKPTLPTFSWIGHLKPDDRDLLSSYGVFFPGHPGNVIIEEGAMQTEVFVVISGMLEVRAKQDDGSEILLAQIGPGETLGEISLFDPGPASSTVTAVEFSQLWRIADSDLIHFMEENPGAGNVLLRTLCSILSQRLRQMNPKAFGLSTYAIVDSPELHDESQVESTETEEEELETESAPVSTASAEQQAKPPGAPSTDTAQPSKTKRLSTKTLPVPDPDELDPIL
jgi:CRP-like cAMP-binding protein